MRRAAFGLDLGVAFSTVTRVCHFGWPKRSASVRNEYPKCKSIVVLQHWPLVTQRVQKAPGAHCTPYPHKLSQLIRISFVSFALHLLCPHALPAAKTDFKSQFGKLAHAAHHIPHVFTSSLFEFSLSSRVLCAVHRMRSPPM